MITFFKGNLSQIIIAVAGVFLWISVSWNVLKAWYAGRPLNGIIVTTVVMACIALALQTSSAGIKVLMQVYQ